MFTKSIFTFSLVFFSVLSFASNKSIEENNTSNPASESQAYSFFDINNSLRTYTSLYSFDETEVEARLLNVRFGIKWENGIFVNFGNFGSRGNGVGYNFYDYGDWEFDALIHLGFNAVEIGEGANESDFRAGLRATHYSEDAVFRIIASPISINSDDDGFYLGSWYVKNWQVKNWNIHGIVGASYYSESILDNRFSVQFFNDTENFRSYKAGAGASLEFELGATYALSEHWVFEASIGQTLLSDAIFDSPFVDKRGQTYASAGVVYVF
jgi:hypothetical protein